jgi:hypothetical protein
MIEGDLEIQWKNRRDPRGPRMFGLNFDPYSQRLDSGRREFEIYGDTVLGDYLKSIGIGTPEHILGRIGVGQQRLTVENVVLDDRHARRYLV